MSERRTSVVQRAAQFLTPRGVLFQTALGVVALLLLAIWLQVPDASVVDVLGSLLLGLLLVGVVGGGETWLIERLAGQRWSRRSLLWGTSFWLVAACAWLVWFRWMAHLEANTYLYASYINSKLPHGLRVLLSYSRLMAWMDWAWTTLAWGAGAVLAVPVVAAVLHKALPGALGQVYSSMLWWLAVVLATDVGVYGTSLLLHWVPGHALGVEMMSLGLRLLATVLLDGFVVSVLLSAAMALLGGAGPAQPIPEGTPLTSQPRIVDIP